MIEQTNLVRLQGSLGATELMTVAEVGPDANEVSSFAGQSGSKGNFFLCWVRLQKRREYWKFVVHDDPPPAQGLPAATTRSHLRTPSRKLLTYCTPVMNRLEDLQAQTSAAIPPCQPTPESIQG